MHPDPGTESQRPEAPSARPSPARRAEPDALGISLLAAFWTLLLAISAGWVGDGLNDDCLWVWLLGECDATGRPPGLARILFAAGLFGLAALSLYRLARQLVRVRHLARSQVTPHAAVIAAISPFNASLERTPSGLQLRSTLPPRGDAPQPEVLLRGRLAEDIQAVSEAGWRWPGQQFLRALEPHVNGGTLTDLVLIGSAGTRGSFDSLPLAERMAKQYCPDLRVVREPEHMEFENLEAMQRCFDTNIDRLVAAGLDESEIIIDLTGGQKTSSIAAALTTLNRPAVQFQYVQTEARADDEQIAVIAFDVVAESLQRNA